MLGIEAPPSVKIVRAQIELGHLDAIKVVMARANEHAKQSKTGQPQWPNVEFVHEQLRHHIAVGEYHVAIDPSQEVIGGVAVTRKDGMWPDRDRVSALYFHKLMKDPLSRYSAGLGRILLDFVAQQAQTMGISRVRCDVQSDMSPLVTHYNTSYGLSVQGAAWYESLGKPATLLEVQTGMLALRCIGDANPVAELATMST